MINKKYEIQSESFNKILLFMNFLKIVIKNLQKEKKKRNNKNKFLSKKLFFERDWHLTVERKKKKKKTRLEIDIENNS